MGIKRKEQMSPSLPMFEVHIEQVVLHGYSFADAHRLGETIQAKLSKLLQTSSFDHSTINDLSIERLDGGLIRNTAQPKIEVLGARLAGSVHQLLAPSTLHVVPHVQAKSDRAKR